MTAEAGPVPRDGPITDLVLRARDGDQQAWDALVERYAPLVGRILLCHIFLLSGTMKILGWSATAAQMEAKGMPLVPLFLVAPSRRQFTPLVRALRDFVAVRLAELEAAQP